MANPNDVRFVVQSRRINERLDRIGVPTPARRASARRNGYRGVLTRAELAKRVSNA